MVCRRTLEGFSDFRDGLLAEAEESEFRAHLDACPECRRYAEVLDRGVCILRSIPELGLPEDFVRTVRRRVRQARDPSLPGDPGLGGAGGIVVPLIALAALLGILSGVHRLRSLPEVRLAPVAASAPSQSAGSAGVPRSFLLVHDPGRWREQIRRETLYRTSPLGERYAGTRGPTGAAVQ